MSIPIKRCALYTRKSSNEGLDQEFNSLKAQRESCEAYVKSQTSEGWRAIDTCYDDGGISGATMERPGLKQLLADIALGKVDVVVVYKIDRLTRALADFARMVELFDRHEVSFVSVTQAFNTTSSMGRLTLNVLLSFAQFEREVTGERIRDKIAASKAKGMWMGGILPLGYDAPVDNSRALTINPSEAETVRTIYKTYLELGSVLELERWLASRNIRSKRRITRNGKELGNKPFSRGALFHMLRNRTYLGMIVHKDKIHPGKHQGILDTDLFDQVKTLMDKHRRRTNNCQRRVIRAPLIGRIVDENKNPMSPTFSRGARGKLYRYYVSAPLQQGRKLSMNNKLNRRIPAALLEAKLIDTLERTINQKGPDCLCHLTRVEIHRNSVHLLVPIKYLAIMRPFLQGKEFAEQDPIDPKLLRLSIPLEFGTFRDRAKIIDNGKPKTKLDYTLIKALRTAHKMVELDGMRLPTLKSAPTSPWQRKLVRLVFLAPDLQKAILQGRQPPGLTLNHLMDANMPISWEDQRVWVAVLSQNHKTMRA